MTGQVRSAWRWLEGKIGDMMPDLLLVVVGTLLIAGGLDSMQRGRPIEGGLVTSGRIVGFKEQSRPDGGQPDRFPIVEFPGPGEGTRRFVVEFTGFGYVGQTVPVRYDPDDPTRAEWVDQPGRWMWRVPVVLGALAWVLLFAVWWRRWRSRRGAAEPEGR